MKYKAVIFDLDGVICHTDKYHFQAWKKITDELGILFNEEINKRLLGVSREESFEIILENYQGVMTDEDKKYYATKKNDYYRQLLGNMSPDDVTDEVKDTLKQLRRSGILTAIGSSSKNAKFILNRIGLEGFFDAVSDGTNITRSKPDPEVFLKASEFLGVAPKDCIVVEDAKAGIQAAIAGGMDSAAIGDAVSSGLANYNLNNISELLKFVF